MKPTILIDVFGREFVLKSYSLFMFIGAILVIVISIWNIKQAGLSTKSSLLCFLSMIIGVLVGARLLNVLINWDYYMINRERIFAFNTSGFSLMGGLILAGILGIISAKLLKLDFWKLGDSIAPGLGIGLISMRIGCFLNGCCYGLPSKLPWSIKFPYNSFAHKYYLSKQDLNTEFSIFKSLASPSLHPTQIYEMIGALIATIVAIVIIRRKKNSGVAILSFSIIFTITRLINHFFRAHPETNITPIWFYPIFYIVVIIILLILLINRLKSSDIKT